MIKKIMTVLSANIVESVLFVNAAWGVSDAYRIREWGWFVFFAIFLLLYIFKFARISAFYDEIERQGNN